jgi:magnesium chelatase family protein
MEKRALFSDREGFQKKAFFCAGESDSIFLKLLGINFAKKNMLVKVYGASLRGLDAIPVVVEVNIGGSFGYVLVGLPDNAVKESKERVETAIRHLGYPFPQGKIVINLAPADVRKEGSAYDLPIALGILTAAKYLDRSHLFQDYMVMGELSLDGYVKPIRGALPIALKARELGFKGILFPKANAEEVSMVKGLDLLFVSHLREAVDFFNGKGLPFNGKGLQGESRNGSDFPFLIEEWDVDFADVKGQEGVKRAMEIAAAGGHNLLMIGPPGSGKTLLAIRFPTILPPLTLEEAVETTMIYSVAGLLKEGNGLIKHRPFRAPHHTISDVALIGGGSKALPGEISLAHNGVLFLDELPEFRRSTLEALRQPLESGEVTIARARMHVSYPARFLFLASMNPCPCGYYSHPVQPCRCSPYQIQRYRQKLSGPLLDRIDLHIEVQPLSFDEMTAPLPSESSRQIRERVIRARKVQEERFRQEAIRENSRMGPKQLERYCPVKKEGLKLLKVAMEKLGLSARAYSKIVKVARTIADLEQTEMIEPHHVAESIQYRLLDRKMGQF